jgi:DNA-binding XRE family transcriptional regulator
MINTPISRPKGYAVPKAKMTPAEADTLRRAGQGIREMRETAGLAQQDIADIFGWSRDAISKIERGVNTISLFQYLKIIDCLREVDRAHPALPLARLLGIGRHQAQ